ncbi:MAG: MBL fold metallo-hydrolase [Actinobacteria bacterium]|nr:MBL fold metallo-hydrolase [Actinomycetota bacterium]MSX69494.1 MBL fold metallo-hydrolase [Actinomycetota bacterium]MSY15895.1 MBL fold metallo-hydrolase [Actinomycetota bacterium]MSZ54149.1 MBL fold metallo-hydrolase [Actinomycetota bacterium]
MFQGLKELRLKNWEPFPINPAEINAIIITHAHLDHSGYLPRLVRDGFNGKIYLTQDTAKLVEIVLRDSARIQMEDAKYAEKKGYSKHEKPEALYNLEDANKTITKFAPIKFHEQVEIAPSISATFHRSGHILGSSVVEVLLDGKRIVFSGDLGRSQHPLLNPPDPMVSGAVDAVIMESTYGDRKHEDTQFLLEQTINKCVQRNGSILIPAFAVDRTEVILMILKRLVKENKIPNLPIFVDSPMALASLNIYKMAMQNGSTDIKQELLDSVKFDDPFNPGNLKGAETVEESKALNDPSKSCIIISASGMGSGGRVVHHLENMLPHSEHAVILIGYQAEGTRGRALVEGVKSVKMHGKQVSVFAEIVQIQGLSVHADADEVCEWLGTNKTAPTHTFIVHGEPASSAAMAEKINSQLGWNTVVPKLNQKFYL